MTRLDRLRACVDEMGWHVLLNGDEVRELCDHAQALADELRKGSQRRCAALAAFDKWNEDQ